MKKIGLTGNIGTGKSTVAWMFNELGAPIIDTDELAHQAIEPHTKAWTQIFDRYGKAVLMKDQMIDRKRLAQIIFHDMDERKFLESIIHPPVKEEVRRKAAKLSRNGIPYCLIEVPLLYEVGWEVMMDLVVVVSCDEEAEIKRCQEKHGIDSEEVLLRLASQMPLEKKIAKADIIVDNSGPLDETRVQVERLYRAWEKGNFSKTV